MYLTISFLEALEPPSYTEGELTTFYENLLATPTVQLEPETDAAISDQKQTQLEEDLHAVTEIEQRLLDDGYLLTDNARDMDTWVTYISVLSTCPRTPSKHCGSRIFC